MRGQEDGRAATVDGTWGAQRELTLPEWRQPPWRLPPSRWLSWHRLRWPLVMAAGVVALFCCALREAGTAGLQSDGASQVLQAWAMLHGNPLLHGWYVSDVSFYTTELPEYVAVELVRGLRPDVTTICSALTYTLLVVLAAVTARGNTRGGTGWARAAIAVAIMLGPSVAAVSVLLNDADHTGTAVPVLAAFALIDRAGKRWYVPVAVTLVLTLALVGDSLVLLIGVVPVLLVCGTRACRQVLQQRKPLTAARYELSLVAAALFAVVAASVTARLLRAAGGYTRNASAHQQVVPSSQMSQNLWATIENFLKLYSADVFGQRLDIGFIPAAIHLVAAALVLAGLWLGLRRLLSGDLVVALLAWAIAVNLLAYGVLFRVTGGTVREVAPVFALGAALAGRTLAGPLLRNGLAPVLAVWLVCALWAMTPGLIVKPAAGAVAPLASWLERNDLHQGIAGYWEANVVTVDSGGQVTMRSVRARAGKKISPFPWELDASLLNSREYDVTFLVAMAPGAKLPGVTSYQAVATFGRPYRTYHFEQYVIMVWRKNLLPELTSK